MAKTIKFNLVCDQKPVRTIEDLQNNFSIEDVLSYYHNGLLTRWLEVRGYEEELEKVKTMQAVAFVPAHAEVTGNIVPLAQYNIDKVLEIADHIVERCAEPVIFEELLKRLFDDYGLTLTFEQYALVGSTVKSYLAWLKDTGRLTVLFEDNRLLWRRV